MRKAAALLVLSSLFALALLTAPATADSWTWRDKGGKGPLSIAKVQAGHGRHGPTVTITFDQPLNPSAMGRKDFVVLDLETNGKGTSEAWIYFFGVRGRIRSYYYVPAIKTGWEDGAKFTRPDARSIKVVLPPSYPDDSGHMFAVGARSQTGCSPRCWDVVPNRGYLIHDWTDPVVPKLPAPEWSLDGQVSVEWRGSDAGFSRLRRTTLMTGPAGSGKWRPVASRSGTLKHTARVVAPAGGHMMFQVLAEDWARNSGRSSVVATRIPYDQTNPAGGGAFSGAWLESEDESRYGGSVHTSSAPLDSFTFSGAGNSFCVFFDWDTPAGSASYTVDGATRPLQHDPGSVETGLPECLDFTTVEERTATLTVDAGRLNLDGYWRGRIGGWTKAGTAPGGDGVIASARSRHIRRSSLNRLTNVARSIQVR